MKKRLHSMQIIRQFISHICKLEIAFEWLYIKLKDWTSTGVTSTALIFLRIFFETIYGEKNRLTSSSYFGCCIQRYCRSFVRCGPLSPYITHPSISLESNDFDQMWFPLRHVTMDVFFTFISFFIISRATFSLLRHRCQMWPTIIRSSHRKKPLQVLYTVD